MERFTSYYAGSVSEKLVCKSKISIALKILKTQADLRGCIYKKAHTIPGTACVIPGWFFVMFITGMCSASADLTSMQKTRGGHQRSAKTPPHLAAVPSRQCLGMGAVLSTDPGKAGQILCPRTGESRDVFQGPTLSMLCTTGTDRVGILC